MSNEPKFSGELLAKARAEASISQAALAEAVGVTRGAIALYEGDGNVPGANVLARIAKFLNKPFEYFFTAAVQNNEQQTA